MSSNEYVPPLHVVPDTPTSSKRRFAALLVMREAAYRAFDKARAVPRSAIAWAMTMFHRWVEATGSAGVLSWLGAHARAAVGLIREAGVVPSVLAVLSVPPVAAAAVRVAKFVGRGMVSVARAAWTGTKSLLGLSGSTGTTIVKSLSRAGTQVAKAAKVVARHPMVKPVVPAFKATLVLVRPVSRGVVVNRLLAALVPGLWLRAVIGFLFMPFLVDANLVGNVRDWASSASTQRGSTRNDDAEGADRDLLTETFGSATPMPGENADHDATQADIVELADEERGDKEPASEEGSEEEPFLNRAERRAKQREDKRSQHPHR